MFDLSGRIALVTGAGQGTGAGIARCLAAQGAAVAVNDVVAERAQAVAREIVAAGRRAIAAPFDVTDRATVESGVAAVVASLGPVDVLVNNAGNAGALPFNVRPFLDLDPQEWPRFVDVNFYGVLSCIRAVLPGMCERGWGRVITISSGAGVVGLSMGVSIYGGGKGAALAFMRHLSQEVARSGVTANSLALGLMVMADQPEVTRGLARSVPVGRLGEPDEVGAACVWLASNEAAFVTGQTIHLNGGAVTT